MGRSIKKDFIDSLGEKSKIRSIKEDFDFGESPGFKFTPKPDFSNARPLIKRELRNVGDINHVLLYMLKLKLGGMSRVASNLFPTEKYEHIHSFTKRIDDDFENLKKLESSQARSFWRNAKIYVNRLGIPFIKREKRRKKKESIDILNYRLNIVGSMLREQSLRFLGTGSEFITEFNITHKKIRIMDLVEPARPILYFIVFKTIFTSVYQMKQLAREYIDRYTFWMIEWIAMFSLGLKTPRKLPYVSQMNEISKRLSKEGIFRGKVFIGMSVTKTQSIGVIEYVKQSKEAKAGNKIHYRLLSEFSQPLVLYEREYEYAQIMAEVPVYSADGNMSGRIDLLVLGKDLEYRLTGGKAALLVCDVKSYVEEYKDINRSHISQVNHYCDLLSENGYDTRKTHRLVVYVRRGDEIRSLRPYIDWIIEKNFTSERFEYNQFKDGKTILLHWR